MATRQGPIAPGREEAAVQARSAELRKELSIADLAFAQILFIVGLQWVGVAAKQGPAHVIFWLIAIALFYLPSAIVAVWLNRAMPLEGGLYQWAKLGFNERFGFIVAWNLWLFAILNMTNVGLQFTQYLGYIFGPRVAELMAQNWVICVDDRGRRRRADLDHRRRPSRRQVGAHGGRRPDARDLRDDHRAPVAERRERDARGVSPASDRHSGDFVAQSQPARQDGNRRIRRLRIRRHSRR